VTVSAYLLFDGRGEEAVRFYERCLGAKAEVARYAGTPAEAHVPPEWRDKVLHARLAVGGSDLMASDAPPDRYQKPQGFSVAVQTKDPAEAERVFQALSEGGRVEMPMQQTFWAARFGSLVDRFGVKWMINCEAA
jgi:PhnB protein